MKLPESFFIEEAICDYRVYKGTKDVWAVNLDLLAVFQHFCKEHSLQFFMGFGTLLGAVRHRGFIPWDDDVDILMPRPDFERLIRLADVFEPPYFLQTSENDPGFWHRGMLKFRNSNTACIEQRDFQASFNQGIALEILPLDVMPDGFWQRLRYGMCNGFFQHLLWAKLYRPGACFYPAFYHSRWKAFSELLKWQLFRCAAVFFRAEDLKRYLRKLWMACDGAESSCYGIYASLGWSGKPIPRDIFSETVQLPFENLYLPAPKDAAGLLKLQYGKSFLQSMPKEWRFPHHPALWAADASYKVYQERFQGAFQHTEGKIIVLFGTGNMVLDYLKHKGRRFPPAFYVDNNPKKWGTKLHGVLVKAPQALLEIPEEKLHLIICNNFYREIGKQLQSMGIEQYYVYTDNFRILFGAPNDICYFSRKKIYSSGCVFLLIQAQPSLIIRAIKQARMRCDCLQAVLWCEDNTLDSYELHMRFLWLQEFEGVGSVAVANDKNIAVCLDNCQPKGIFFSVGMEALYQKMKREMGAQCIVELLPFVRSEEDEYRMASSEKRKKYHLGYVQGTFDLFHVGHLNLLRRAWEQCDSLLVGVVSDELNEQYKGRKPYISYEDRAEIVASVRYVDRVICITPQNENKLQLWEQYRFDCHFSGDDHTGWENLIHELRERGSNVEFFPYTQKISSTKIREQLAERGRYGIAANYPCDKLPKRIALYGAGRLGQDLYRRLWDDPSRKVVFWMDKKAGSEVYEGLPVYSLDRLAEHSYDCVVIAVKNPLAARGIRSALLQAGVLEEKIFWSSIE